MDFLRNSVEFVDRYVQLFNVIVEFFILVFREGRILFERVSRDDFGVDGVRRKVSIIFYY